MKWVYIFYLCLSPILGHADQNPRIQNPDVQTLYDWLFANPPKYFGDIKKIENIFSTLSYRKGCLSEFYELPEVQSGIHYMKNQAIEKLQDPAFYEGYINYLKRSGLYFDYGEEARKVVIQYLNDRKKNSPRPYTPLEAERHALEDFNRKYGSYNLKEFKKEYKRLENRYLLSEKEDFEKTVILSRNEHAELSFLLARSMDTLWEKQISFLIGELSKHKKAKAYLESDNEEPLLLDLFYKKHAALFHIKKEQNLYEAFKTPIHLVFHNDPIPVVYSRISDFFQPYLDLHTEDDINFVLERKDINQSTFQYISHSINAIPGRLPVKLTNTENLFSDFHFRDWLKNHLQSYVDIIKYSHKYDNSDLDMFRRFVGVHKRYFYHDAFRSRPSDFEPSQKEKSVEWQLRLEEKNNSHDTSRAGVSSFFTPVSDESFSNSNDASKTLLYTLTGTLPKQGTFFSIININSLADAKFVSLRYKNLVPMILTPWKLFELSQELKISNAVPLISEDGILGLPTPEFHILKDVMLSSKGSPLKINKDFKIYHSPSQDAYFLKVSKNIPLPLDVQIIFEPDFSKHKDLSHFKSLSNLDPEKFKKFIPELKKIELHRLAKHLSEEIEFREKMGETISTQDLAQIISGKASLYSSYDFHKTDLLPEAENCSLGGFAKYANEDGIFYTQCDGANSLLTALLQKYFEKDADYSANYSAQIRNGFVFQEKNSLSANSFHRITTVLYKNQLIQILDATPRTMGQTAIVTRKTAMEIIYPQMSSNPNQTEDFLKNKLKSSRAQLIEHWQNLSSSQKKVHSQVLKEIMTYSRIGIAFSEGQMSLQELLSEVKRVHPEAVSLALNNSEEILKTLTKRVSDLNHKIKWLKPNPKVEHTLFLINLTELLEATDGYFKNAMLPIKQCSSLLE